MHAPSEAELEGYVISVVAAIDAPLKPRQLARRQDADLFCHRPASWRIEMRDRDLLRSRLQRVPPCMRERIALALRGASQAMDLVKYADPERGVHGLGLRARANGRSVVSSPAQSPRTQSGS